MSCGTELSEIRMQETRGSSFESISQFAGFFSPSKPMPSYNLNEATATSFQIPCNSLSISHHTNGRYIAGVSKTGSHNHWCVSTWLPFIWYWAVLLPYGLSCRIKTWLLPN